MKRISLSTVIIIRDIFNLVISALVVLSSQPSVSTLAFRHFNFSFNKFLPLTRVDYGLIGKHWAAFHIKVDCSLLSKTPTHPWKLSCGNLIQDSSFSTSTLNLRTSHHLRDSFKHKMMSFYSVKPCWKWAIISTPQWNPLSPRPCAHGQSILDPATFPDFITGVDRGSHQGSKRSQPRSQLLRFLRAKSKWAPEVGWT